MARIVKKPEERRREIVAAARSLFEEKGYDQVTMRDVIDAVGIAKGTVYHYFASKNQLVEAVIVEIADEMIGNVKNIVDRAEGTALQKMEQLVCVANVSGDEPEVISYLHQQGNEALHVRLLGEVLNRQAPFFAKLIEQGCDEGLFQVEDPLECAEFILAGVQFLTDVGIYPWKAEDLRRRGEAFPKLVEQLLCALPGSCAFLGRYLPHGME